MLILLTFQDPFNSAAGEKIHGVKTAGARQDLSPKPTQSAATVDAIRSTKATALSRFSSNGIEKVRKLWQGFFSTTPFRENRFEYRKNDNGQIVFEKRLSICIAFGIFCAVCCHQSQSVSALLVFKNLSRSCKDEGSFFGVHRRCRPRHKRNVCGRVFDTTSRSKDRKIIKERFREIERRLEPDLCLGSPKHVYGIPVAGSAPRIIPLCRH
jgi:hypothetical protein